MQRTLVGGAFVLSAIICLVLLMRMHWGNLSPAAHEPAFPASTASEAPQNKVPVEMTDALPLMGGRNAITQEEGTSESCRDSSVSSPCSIAVRASDTLGNGLAAATVSAFAGEESSLLGFTTTDADGLAQLALDDAPSGISLAVSSPEYATEWLYWECPCDSIVPVVLHPCSSISGNVQCNGEAVPNAQVFAWPENYYQMSKAPASRALRTTSDGTGLFAFHDVRPGLIYSLRAGSEGRLSMSARNVEAPAEGLRLELQRVFASLIMVRENGGSVPGGKFMGSLSARPLPGATQIAHNLLSVAGIEQELLASAQGYDQFVAFISGSREPALGPIHLVYAMPGYVPAERDTWLYPLDTGQLHTDELTLEPVGEMGSVLVHLGHLPAPMRTTRMVWPLLIISMMRGGPPVSLPLLTMESLQEFSGIPTGEYWVEVATTYGQYVYRCAERVHVGRQPADLFLDFSELGAVRIEIVARGGTPYTGLLTLDVGPYGFGSEGTVNYAGGPYWLLLPSGKFSVTVGMPKMLTSMGKYEVAGFEVRAGTKTTLVLDGE